MKKLKAILMLLALTVTLFACKGVDVKASTPTESVSVTVPTNMDIIFNEDGTTSVSELYVANDSLVPIEIKNVKIAEFNDWKVVPDDSEILVNSKQVSLHMEEKDLVSGSNAVGYEVPEGGSYDFSLQVGHGAWTQSMAPEKALEIEFEYEIGTKEFLLYLDGNGGTDDVEIYAENGSTVTLPAPEREGYEFAGWEDEDGNVYNSNYTMPIGDVTLKAIWRKLTAYALFASSDGSLTFVQSVDAIKVGQTHNGKTITTVYTGFEETAYTSYTQVPWYADGNNKNIKSVMMEDVIKPISTAYWFYQCQYCMNFDVTNLNTSKVTSMKSMYYMAGREGGTGSFIITGMDTWDTSQVTNMFGLFEASAIFASTYNIGNVGKWDVSKVTNMCRTFSSAGMRAKDLYIGDLSTWDTGSLETTVYMFKNFGYETPTVNIGNIGKWDVSNVTDMYSMFSHFGYQSTSVYMGDLSNWNVSKVTDFGDMFYWCAMYVPNWNFGNLGKWNVASSTSFSAMFCNAGCYSKTFYVGTLQNWNTANAQYMGSMFECAGEVASWSLNCKNWNVKKVTYYEGFNDGVESKVTAPNWVN